MGRASRLATIVNLEHYQRFSDAVLAWAEAEPAVLGLVAAGSMARRTREPDEWSDHDFWLITEPGAEECYRAAHDWLPDAGRIVLAFRETTHGVKVVYDDGHLVEYAVFTPDELAVTKANEYRVLLDRERIGERLRAVRAATVDGLSEPAFTAGQFLTQLLVAAARARRGERLSARSFLTGAVEQLTRLAAAHVPAERPEAVDDIDPRRRFEVAFPALAAEIDAALADDPEVGARSLLELADRELGSRAAPWTGEALAAIRRYLTE